MCERRLAAAGDCVARAQRDGGGRANTARPAPSCMEVAARVLASRMSSGHHVREPDRGCRR